MATNKVVYGDEVLMDVSQDTVTPETLAEGTTAHNADGEPIVGTMVAGSGIIEVSELPTENIDENAVYKVVVNTEQNVYMLRDGVVYTAEQYATSTGMGCYIYYVDELPSNMEVTYSDLHLYVLNSSGVGYIDFAQSGNTHSIGAVLFGSAEYDRGYTDNIYNETLDGIYVTRSAHKEDWFVRESGEWKRISPDVQPKEVTYTENGDYEILPDSGKQLSKATVKVAVPERYDEGYEAGKLDGYSEGYTASQNARQEKSITQNGEYTPDEGYSGFSKVTVNVTDVDTIDGWHVDVRSDGSAPPSGTINTITFVYGG